MERGCPQGRAAEAVGAFCSCPLHLPCTRAGEAMPVPRLCAAQRDACLPACLPTQLLLSATPLNLLNLASPLLPCRYNEWVGRHGGAGEALKEACRLVLQYAQQVRAVP